jgi:hypothetical protein
LGIGDWGLGIGDWGLGPIPNPQSPIPNPQSPLPLSSFLIKKVIKIELYKISKKFNFLNKILNSKFILK